MKVVFFPSLKTAEVDCGTSLIKAAETAGVLIDASCNGMGTCGKCKVRIDGREVLACQTIVDRDMEVFVPSTHGGSDRKKRMVRLPDGFVFDADKDYYGIAYDIGTTTVVGMLWDLKNGVLVDVDTRTNYQSLYGADVISRIGYSMREKDGLEKLQRKVIECLNDITCGICEHNEICKEDIVDATVVGNTTMSHILLGVNPKSLARMPFAPVFCDAQDVAAGELGIDISADANVHVLPNIAGHVGSDITAMMLAAGFSELEGSHIAIDIGTNGEVVAIKDGKMVCCSTAAGPAFEGATIAQGMRAATGAIEKVVIDGAGVQVKTIGDAPAVGICGSGLIDAVAQLLDTGIVNASGKMLSKEQALELGLSTSIAERIVQQGNLSVFVLANDAEPIMITQNDIREVQLAKGAILAGIQTLMKNLDMKLEDIDSIMLAGAFGNYIDIRSALRIGLLPQVGESKVVAIGNAAGNGSSMALLSRDSQAHADNLAKMVEHIELSRNMDFQEFYMTAMTFEL